jgi:hypothetical protein
LGGDERRIFADVADDFALKQLEKNPWVFGCTEGGFCECGGAWDVGTTSFSLINFW